MASKSLPKNLGEAPLFCILKAFIFEVLFASLQEGPRGTQEGPRGAQEARGSLQERPKRLQEASTSAPGGSNRASRDLKSRSRGLKTRPRGAKSFPRRPQSFSEAPGPAAVFGKMKKLKAYAHKVFPKHLVRQLFSEKWKNSKHGSKRHRRRLRSPVSMNPKGLASNRRKKKSGRAAVVPLGEVNPPPAPEGRSRACQIKSQMPNRQTSNLQS